jgi:hypothetical protein
VDAPGFDQIAWDRLSEESKWTVMRIVGPMVLGYRVAEIAERLGKTTQWVQGRLTRLRHEILTPDDGVKSAELFPDLCLDCGGPKPTRRALRCQRCHTAAMRARRRREPVAA